MLVRRRCTFSLAPIQRKSYQKERSPLLMHLLKTTAPSVCAGKAARHHRMVVLHQMFTAVLVACLQMARPSEVALFLTQIHQRRIYPPTAPAFYMFADAHTVETVFRSLVLSFFRSFVLSWWFFYRRNILIKFHLTLKRIQGYTNKPVLLQQAGRNWLCPA